MKPAMQEVQLGGTTFFSPSEMTVGQEVTGRYAGNQKSGQYDSITHYVITADGNRAGINGSGKLNKLLERVVQGSEITIRYLGEAKIESGKFKGKTAHDWKVFVATPSKDADFSADLV